MNFYIDLAIYIISIIGLIITNISLFDYYINYEKYNKKFNIKKYLKGKRFYKKEK